MFLLRVGEARHPGPSDTEEFCIGTLNPTGLLGKGSLLKELPVGAYGMAETHVTLLGLQRFRHELHVSDVRAKYIPGAPAPPLSSAPGSLGGKATGVGLLTHYPARALSHDWPDTLWSTGRIQACACLVGQAWIKIGIGYGYAQNPLSTDYVAQLKHIDAQPEQLDPMQQLFGAVEMVVDDHLKTQGKQGLLPQQFGRCMTMRPELKYHPVAPLRKARLHDVQVEYHGEHFQHVQWCRQLRRLQSFVRGCSHENRSDASLIHQQQLQALWDSIRGAKGFPRGFPRAWQHRSHCTPGSPKVLPKKAPPRQVAEQIFVDFQAEFRSLEKLLNAKRVQGAKARRLADPNVIFSDVRRPRSLPAQTLITKQVAHVEDFDPASRQVTYSPPNFDSAVPVIGKDHFKKLRAAAMAAMGWAKKGASSLIQFALVQHCHMDPEGLTCWQTLLAFRLHADPAVAFPLLDALIQFAQSLAQAEPAVLIETPPSTPEPWQLFVDGACQRPRDPHLRLATWGVVRADLHQDTFVPVSFGLLPGALHTAMRAEIFAAWIAVRVAVASHQRFMLWTDNQVVFDRIFGWLRSPGKPFGPNSKDADLWNCLRHAVLVAHAQELFLHVVKVRSHEDITAYSDHLEQWVIRGNMAVDQLALQALSTVPPSVWWSWQAACNKHDELAPLREAMHTLLYLVGKHAVECKGNIRHRDQQVLAEQASAIRFEDRLSFAPLPPSLDGFSFPTMNPHQRDVFDWLQVLQSGGETEQVWFCGHQLLALFQSMTNRPGYQYSANRYHVVTRYEDFNFCRLAAWLNSLLKALARCLGLPVIVERRPPSGSSYRSWQSCMLMPVALGTVLKVDRLFQDKGIVPIIHTTRAFDRVFYFGED
eukprot:Skav230726  [mRNA]  locus=scaffold401:228508:233396:- [translate_table: standard]